MFKKWFDSTRKELKLARKIADKIELLAPKMKELALEDFPLKTEEFKERYRNGETLDDLLVEAFALVREAATRVLNMTPYYVQLLGGIVIHRGNIAEMKTGEGKTLTAVMPAYLNALSGEGVHIVTVNEYLAKREAEGEIGDLFRFLGLTVGLNVRELSQDEKKEAYAADVMYSTNSELGFDYLRDHMVLYAREMVAQRGYKFAIIDEIDSILIDEARTPLIISGPAKEGLNLYMLADRFVKSLTDEDIYLDVETKTVELSPSGISKGEANFNIDNLFDINHVGLLHHVLNALRANYIMERDKDYLVEDNAIVIIDQFTGRKLHGRQYSEGLHQAIEAKENVEVKKETVTVATITYQNFFRMYDRLSGMTGTAKTEEDEFVDIYNMRVVEIPTNKPLIRKDDPDRFFMTIEEKNSALVDEVARRNELGQPVLIGTISVEASEELSVLLRRRRIKHEVLNAKNHEREADIVASAGQKHAVTIATNMAGRGTDIKLGEGVVELGGLAVIGSEKHEARRIDNQLRGRSGRQGDPGYSVFFLSGEDELLVRRGGERFKSIISMLRKATPDGQPVTSKMVSRIILGAQKRSEGNNAEARRNVLKYDDVLRMQREIIYEERRQILTLDSIEEKVVEMIHRALENEAFQYIYDVGRGKVEIHAEELVKHFEQRYFPKGTFDIEELKTIDENSLLDLIQENANKLIDFKRERVPNEIFQEFLKVVLLRVIDSHWMRHIDTMSELRQGVRLQSYGQMNPLIIYQQEGKKIFDEMIYLIESELTRYVLLANIQVNVERKAVVKNTSTNQGDDNPRRRDRRKRARGRNLPWNR